MENFIYSIPTTIYFGKGQIEHVAQAVRPFSLFRSWDWAPRPPALPMQFLHAQGSLSHGQKYRSFSSLINKFLGSGLMGMGGGGGDISRIPMWLSAAAVGFAIVIGMLAGLFPALRAMKLSPLAAIRNE